MQCRGERGRLLDDHRRRPELAHHRRHPGLAQDREPATDRGATAARAGSSSRRPAGWPAAAAGRLEPGRCSSRRPRSWTVGEGQAEVEVGAEVVGLDRLHRRVRVVEHGDHGARRPAGGGRGRRRGRRGRRTRRRRCGGPEHAAAATGASRARGPRPVGRASPAAGRGARGRSSTSRTADAVGGEPGVALEVAQGSLGLGPEDAVDPAGVEAEVPSARCSSATSSPRSIGLAQVEQPVAEPAAGLDQGGPGRSRRRCRDAGRPRRCWKAQDRRLGGRPVRAAGLDRGVEPHRGQPPLEVPHRSPASPGARGRTSSRSAVVTVAAIGRRPGSGRSTVGPTGTR